MNITIGEYSFTRASKVEVRKSTEQLANTALIVVPISATLVDKDERSTVEIAKSIKKGDAVTIELFYQHHDSHAETFKGFVKRVNYSIPVEIECEDATYLLRKKNIQKSWKSTSLKDVLKEIISGTAIELAGSVPSVKLEPFYLKNVDGAFALQKLKDEYGLSVYFNESGQLYVGLAYTEYRGDVKYQITGDECNVISADELKFRSADEVSLKVKAISIHGDNTKTEIELGDKDGALRTLYFYNITDAAELKQLAEQEIKKYKFDGYEGSLSTFLLPKAVPGMVAVIEDQKFERGGDYFIIAVTTTMGEGGSRRKIEIGIKL